MYKIQKDEFNSERFNLKMGNIVINSPVCEDFSLIKNEAIVQGYQHLSVKVSTDNLSMCNLFLENGFYIVDTLVSYVFDYIKTPLPTLAYRDDIFISPIRSDEVKQIRKIAHNSFYNDRFHNDPNLSKELCDAYYEKWIENSCNGFADLVLVCRDEANNLLAFGTGKYYDAQTSALVLNAVTEFARGKGVYTEMICEAMKFFRDKSEKLTLGTQINNYAVQKAWSKLGFSIFESYYVLHCIL